ncbi:sulfite exporter TauE/SafE family protein [Amylibacter sp. IMCC11727]|uniref:sulfite exporter TauE/SafE family protein n=1 Tax=Amylibacter sp. IMCC11727 TaxID=3039851 RepID=UPI00244DFFF0|nr:sulfite exporter TauE/SafE family protein [Amylibacter sp. IMCC11727]WGI23469.1 sulfite exporter TauE/SafE family protein [Amylibacter sp. IMCC11727]
MDAISTALAVDGLWWIFIGAVLAGIVRGFTGFGTAMVFLPFAGAVLNPIAALLSLVCMDIFGPLPLVPNALRKGHPRDIALMGLGMIVMLPVGVYLLGKMEGSTYRYVVSIATLIALIVLISGFRYTRALTSKVIVVTGGLGGFLGGVAGLPGPPVTVLYMASKLPVETVRANMILFLLMADILIFPIMAMQGMLSLQPFIIGALMLLPYMAGSAIGVMLFNPEKELVYRLVAYGVIAGSAILGLPFVMQ